MMKICSFRLYLRCCHTETPGEVDVGDKCTQLRKVAMKKTSSAYTLRPLLGPFGRISYPHHADWHDLHISELSPKVARGKML